MYMSLNAEALDSLIETNEELNIELWSRKLKDSEDDSSYNHDIN
jgi:hypothetical protein